MQFKIKILSSMLQFNGAYRHNGVTFQGIQMLLCLIVLLDGEGDVGCVLLVRDGRILIT